MLHHDVGVYAKKPSTSSGYALVGISVVLIIDGRAVESARIAATGAVDHAIRLTGVANALVGAPLDGDSVSASSQAAEGVEEWQFMDDPQASAEYRRSLLGSYTERALAVAAEGGTGRAAG